MPSAEQLRAWLAAGEREGSRYTLCSPRRVAAGTAGHALGRSVGSSVEFLDHREYQPGDDLRHLDWNASARSERLIVKLYREEVSPCLDLVLDGSASMALQGTDKARAAVGLAALLCTAARGAGWSSQVWWTSSVCQRLGGDPLAAEAWPGELFSAATNPGEALLHRPPQWRQRSVRVLISDLLWPAAPQPVLQRLAVGADAAVVVLLLATADLEPPTTGTVRLEDVETTQQLEVRLNPTLAGRYRDALERHLDVWREAAQTLGLELLPVVAEELVSSWQMEPLLRCGVLEAAP